MDRADHYRAADDLVWKARRAIPEATEPGTVLKAAARIDLLLRAAQVHATLAAVDRDVESQVREQARAAAAAVARAEELRGVGPGVVESPAYGTEPRDGEQPRQSPRVEDWCTCKIGDMCPGHRARATTCRCTATPHDLGSPGCAYPGKGMPR